MSNEVMTRNSEWMNHIVNHLNRMVDNFERAVMNYRPMLDGERFMTDKELCARLQLSRRTLQDYRNNGVIPYIQLGGKILYRESDIQKILMALGEEEPEEKDEKWLLGRIRCGIRHAIEEQTQRKFEDDYLVAKVEKLEAAVRELTEDEEDESSKFSVEELAIILDMDEEEIRDVLRLTGDDK